MPVSVDNLVMCAAIAYAVSFAAVVTADELELPPLGFFDYLGSMVEHEGELVDPLSLRAATSAEQAAEVEPDARAEPLTGSAAAKAVQELQ